MARLQKEALAVCVRLNEVNTLPEETVVEIFMGLTRCSVPEFTKLFDFLLQGARVNALDIDGMSSQDDTLAQVKSFCPRLLMPIMHFVPLESGM